MRIHQKVRLPCIARVAKPCRHTALACLLSCTTCLTWASDPIRPGWTDAVERNIYAGRIAEAKRALAMRPGQTPANVGWETLLQARIRHDEGDWTGSLALLRPQIDRLKARGNDPELLAESCLEYARACRSLVWLAPFGSISDTALLLATRHRLPAHIRARAFGNKALFHVLHFETREGAPSLDSLTRLMDEAMAGTDHLYQTDVGIAIQISFFRNYDYPRARALGDSLFRFLAIEPHTAGGYARHMLWRALANRFNDDVTGPGPSNLYPDARRKCLYSIDKAKAIIRQHYPGNSVDIAGLENLRGLVYQKSGDNLNAWACLKRSERELVRIDPDMQRYYYVHYVNVFYQMFIVDVLYEGARLAPMLDTLQARCRRIARLWPAWERMDRNALGHFRFKYTTDPEYLLVRLCHLRNRLKPDPAWLEEALAAQQRGKYRELGERMQALTGNAHPPAATLRDVRKSLAADEALISASDVHIRIETTQFIIVTRDTLALVEARDVKREIVKSMEFLDGDSLFLDPIRYRDTYHRLWQHIFRDLEPCLRGIRKLLIMPSGYTAGFNFDMLVPDTIGTHRFRDLRLLRDRYHIRYDYSWPIAQMRKQRPHPSASPNGRMALVPDYEGTPLYRLPFFERSAQTLQEQFGFRMYDQGKATSAELLAALPRTDLLHVSAHGVSNIGFNSNPFIILDSTEPGLSHRLSPQELLTTRTDADLAVLSICHGGMSEWSHQEVLNLAYWFSYAGARSCLYAYGRVDDRSTAAILESFYRRLQEGQSRSEALRGAQDEYRRNARSDEELNPIYWAVLTLVGDDGPVPALSTYRKPSMTGAGPWLAGIAAALSLLLLGWRLRRESGKSQPLWKKS
ncbi:MAG: CHAT domain-containing protein [Chitinophagia bacterium]|nr:CHAT domain-containing protein [Chitinophagia bacterium]